MPPALLCLRLILASQGLLWLHMNFRIFFHFCGKCLWNLLGIALNLQMALGGVDILTILSLLIHEHGISFHLFVSSSISFINSLQFLVYRSFTSLVKFILKYFIIFLAFVNGIVFFISFSYSLLLAHRNTANFVCWFCILKLTEFVYSNSFLVESLGFSTYKIISFANRDNFTSSFPIWTPLFLFLA